MEDKTDVVHSSRWQCDTCGVLPSMVQISLRIENNQVKGTQGLTMQIIDRGVLNAGAPGSARAISTFPAVATLPDGSLMASYRVGSGKDSADGTVEFRRSHDEGRTWGDPVAPLDRVVENKQGSISVAYITPLSEQHLIMVACWVDRETYPGKPLFNEQTEGCLPMQVLLADSYDLGNTWGPWRVLPCPDDIGPASLTNPLLKLPSGRLAVSVETNKHYEDVSQWMQRVVYLYSDDLGQTWGKPHTVSQDPEARIFYWDQRAAVDTEGRVISFSWTYDRETTKYQPIQRRVSEDEGQTWAGPEALGFADQPSVPAVLPDGKFVLAWVDRFGSCSIRARLAESGTSHFSEDSEISLFEYASTARNDPTNTAKLLSQMELWSFGLPYAEALPGGDVLVVYYEGTAQMMQISWVRLSV